MVSRRVALRVKVFCSLCAFLHRRYFVVRLLSIHTSCRVEKYHDMKGRGKYSGGGAYRTTLEYQSIGSTSARNGSYRPWS